MSRKSSSSHFSFAPFFIVFTAIVGALVVVRGALQQFNSPSAAQGATVDLQVTGTKLTLPDGNRFIVEGVNIELFRDQGCSSVTNGQIPKKNEIIAKMKSLGINAVRLNYRAAWLSQGTNLAQFLDFSQSLAQNGIYVMPSDHTFTGKDLIGYDTTSYPLFKAIVEGARARGFEAYLIMNPYNEPYGSTSGNTLSNWVTANKATVSYIRSLGFKGVIVLDTRTWASSFEPTGLNEVKAHDATLMNGVAKVVFSNHWYPNHDFNSRVKVTYDQSSSVPLLIGELGQINPGSSPLSPDYTKNALSVLVSSGVPQGHNGVFAWMWNWCDSNSMTNNDYTTINTYGQIYTDYFYSKVNGNAPASALPVATPTSSTAPVVVATAVPVVLQNTAGKIEVASGFALNKSSYKIGETVTGSITYKNTGSTAVTLSQVILATRPPGGSYNAGPYKDLLPAPANVVIQPGKTYTLTASRKLESNDQTGQWFAHGTYRDAAGWHDSPTIYFQVAAASTTSTAPTAAPTVQATVKPTSTPVPVVVQATTAPTQAPAQTQTSTTRRLFRAIDFNGSARTIDGIYYESRDSQYYKYTGWRTVKYISLNPGVNDTAKVSMLQSYIYYHLGANKQGASNVILTSLPNKALHIYMYIMEDDVSQTFDVKANGTTVQTGIVSGSKGSWQKLGPWQVTPQNGEISITTTGGVANFSAVEIWEP